MSTNLNRQNRSQATRRQFLKTSSLAAATSGAIAGVLSCPSMVHAAGSNQLRVGLIGCGGRGTGAAIDALRADDDVQLTAMADVFEDRLQSSLDELKKNADISSKLNVPEDRKFVGFDAYQQLIDSGVDVVLLAEPPHFRPLHLRAAVDAGKHIFCEKPIAVDAPGVRSVLETCKLAKEKGLSVVSGLCQREHPGFNETLKRINDGAIGDIHTLYANDYRGSVWEKPRQPDWTDMHYQMRNWYYYTWLSGDFNVEQHIHFLDLCAWMKGGYPDKAIGMGGRQVRTEEKYGNIFDHHSVVYDYADGTKLISNCRQQPGCETNLSAAVQGSRGRAFLKESKVMIYTNSKGPDSKWRFREKEGQKSIYQIEHDRLFASIRSAEPENDGEYMSKSTLLAIMGRMATYTGGVVTWEQAMNSQVDLTPEKYAWGDAPEVVIALPGVTKIV